MSLFIPLYGSLWCLGIASDTLNPRIMTADVLATRMNERKLGGAQVLQPRSARRVVRAAQLRA